MHVMISRMSTNCSAHSAEPLRRPIRFGKRCTEARKNVSRRNDAGGGESRTAVRRAIEGCGQWSPTYPVRGQKASRGGSDRPVCHLHADISAEAGLYRYSDDPAERRAEIPVDAHNHAISALRYLLSKLDARGLKGGDGPEDSPPPEPPPDQPPDDSPPEGRDPWCNVDKDAVFNRVL